MTSRIIELLNILSEAATDASDMLDSAEKEIGNKDETKKPAIEVEKEIEEPKTILELFDEAEKSGSLKIFKKSRIFDARPSKKGEEIKTTWKGESSKNAKSRTDGQYTVIRDHDDIRQLTIVKPNDFKARFEEVRTGQQPDAEGFIEYISNTKFEVLIIADPIKFVGVNSKSFNVKKGEMVIREEGKNKTETTITPTELKTEYIVSK